jgi:hypothetical protein
MPACRCAGVEVGRLDIAADAEFAAGGAHDGEVADDQRRDRQCLPESWLRDLALPGDFAGRLVDGEHAAVERNRDHLVLPQRHAAVVEAATGDVAGPGAAGAGGGRRLALDVEVACYHLTGLCYL